jgi:hypothetical protein
MRRKEVGGPVRDGAKEGGTRQGTREAEAGGGWAPVHVSRGRMGVWLWWVGGLG